MNPYFSQTEYELRYANASRLMMEHRLAALFITAETNLYYLSGHRPFQPWYAATRPTLLIAPHGRTPALIAPSGYYGAATRDTWFPDIRSYQQLSRIPVDMVADVFRELDLDHGRIGVELGIEQRMGLPFSDFSGLQAALPQVEWVDAADLLWQLRLIKSPAEIECMRRASASVMQAFTNVFPLLEPGVTQEQLMHKLNAAISEAGSEPGFIVISCDRETNLAPASLPSQRVADTRQLILVDAGASYHGYWCDFCRGVSLGRPDDRTLRAWEAMYRVTMRGVHTARPGVSVDQIVRACAQQAEEEGFQLNLSGGRMGHSIGLMITELPSMRLGEETVLQPGMTLTLEPSIVLDSTMFVVEQDFAITEEGADILSHGPWEIWVA